MGRVVCVLIVAMLASARCIAAESLYRSASDRIENYHPLDDFTFIAPYFTRVGTTLWISITKTPATSNSQSSQKSDAAPTAPAKPTQALIYFAGWEQTTDAAGQKAGQIRYAVSCDLQKVIQTKDRISITGIEPGAYSGPKTVKSVTGDNIFVEADPTEPAPVSDLSKGTLPVNCPVVAADTTPSLTVTFGVTTTPTARAYLYMSKNAFFSDSVSVGLDSNGMLSNSDSASTQQITSILTELAQTAGQVAFGGVLGGAAPKFADAVKRPPATPAGPRQRCFSALNDLVKYGPYYVNFGYGTRQKHMPKEFDADMALELHIQPLAAATGQEGFDQVLEVAVDGKIKQIGWRNGLLAFYPVPAKATLACTITKNGSENDGRKKDAEKDTVFLSAPSTVNLYTSSQFVDPKRDFLTGPQDTFTFSGGFIIGHKYTDQSSAKTVVDTITAPLRALVPSISVQQNTQVQTGGGKPDQTTTTTSTTTGPPKTP